MTTRSRRQKGRRVNRPCKRLKISKFSHSSHVTKFRSMAQINGTNQLARPSQHKFCDSSEGEAGYYWQSWVLFCQLLTSIDPYHCMSLTPI